MEWETSDYATEPPAALPKVESTRARMPTAALMMIPTLAKVSPVNVLLNNVVLVALPLSPKSILFATVCRFAAIISAIRTQMTRVVIAIISAIRKFSYFLLFDC